MILHTFPSTEPMDLAYFEQAIAEFNYKRPDGGTNVDRFLFLPREDQQRILRRARELQAASVEARQ